MRPIQPSWGWLKAEMKPRRGTGVTGMGDTGREALCMALAWSWGVGSTSDGAGGALADPQEPRRERGPRRPLSAQDPEEPALGPNTVCDPLNPSDTRRAWGVMMPQSLLRGTRHPVPAATAEPWSSPAAWTHGRTPQSPRPEPRERSDTTREALLGPPRLGQKAAPRGPRVGRAGTPRPPCRPLRRQVKCAEGRTHLVSPNLAQRPVACWQVWWGA